LRDILQGVEKATPVRFVPDSFDPADPTLAMVEIPIEWRWESCEKALTRFASRGVMSRLPAWWQLEPPLHAACRSAGAFLYVNDTMNMPLGSAAILRAEIDTIVTTVDDAHAFAAFLIEKGVPLPPSWFIVHQHEKKMLPELLWQPGIQLHEEVQSSPGISYA
jgi:hypothetical protein